jgi:hypothetical protein
MNNSYVSAVLGLYDGILMDASAHYPSLAKSFGRDNARLKQLALNRGLHLFTVDLPNAGEEFDSSLKNGSIPDIRRLRRHVKEWWDYHPSFRGLHQVPVVQPCMGRMPGTRIPRLFGGLWCLVFDRDTGLILGDPDVNAVFFLRQLYYAVKKLKMACPDAATYRAVEGYFRIEGELPNPTLNWVTDVLEPRSDISFEDRPLARALPLFNMAGALRDPHMIRTLRSVQRVCDIVATQLGCPDINDLVPRHGPGVVSDAPRGDKYAFPTWPRKLDTIFPMSQFGHPNYGMWAAWLDGRSGGYSDHEAPSKLIAVPKTQSKPRLIAAEPTSHQWCQQALRTYLESATRSTMLNGTIDFSRQEHNRNMAITASSNRRYATIDLSSASDRLSLWCVERLFRRNPTLLGALHASRTRWLSNNIDKKMPGWIILRKFASQGSAVTFPVQTLFYSCVCVGVLAAIDETRHDCPVSTKRLEHLARSVRVFGDDIIVPMYAYRAVVEVLQHLWLKVNTEKSCASGSFRESCGMDAFEGYDVTPARLSLLPNPKSPESIGSTVQVSNNFHRKGLWHAAAYLRLGLEESLNVTFPTIPVDSGLTGFTSFVGGNLRDLRKRWNKPLQRDEYMVPRLTARVTRGTQPGESTLFQWFTEAPPKDQWDFKPRWDHGWVERVAVKFRLVWAPDAYQHPPLGL